jgi:hypothetical protein
MADYLKRIVARSTGDRAPVAIAPRPRPAAEPDDLRPPEPVHAPSSAASALPALPLATPHAAPALSRALSRLVTLPVATADGARAPLQPVADEPRAEPVTGDPPAGHAVEAREPPLPREMEAPDTADPLAAMDREIRRLLQAAQRADAEPVEAPSTEPEPAERNPVPRAEPRERATALPRLEPPMPLEPTPPRPEARRLVIGRVLVEVAQPAPAAPSPAPAPRPAAPPRPFRAGELRGVAFRRTFGMGQS